MRDFFLIRQFMPSVAENITEILRPITDRYHAFIVDVSLRGERTSKVVEIYIDTDDGISLDDCSSISRELSEQLDTMELIPGRYRLDVSSPGLDRPLKLFRQYRKNIGRVCKIAYVSEGKKVFQEGMLEQVTEETVSVKKNGKLIDIPFSQIKETFIIPQIK